MSAVTDSISSAVEFAQERPAVAIGLGIAIASGAVYALTRPKSNESGTADMVYGMVGDSSKFPPDGYPGVIVSQPQPSVDVPKPIPTPEPQTKPPVVLGQFGDTISSKKLPYRCPSGSIVTWEPGNTGNHVCMRKSDRAIFPVQYK